MRAIKVNKKQWDYVVNKGRLFLSCSKGIYKQGEHIEVQYWVSTKSCYTIEMVVLEEVPLLFSGDFWAVEIINPSVIIIR